MLMIGWLTYRAHLSRQGQSGPGFQPSGQAHGQCLYHGIHGRFRQVWLYQNWFLSLGDAEQKVETWRGHYNGERPHSALGNLSVQEFAVLAEIAE